MPTISDMVGVTMPEGPYYGESVLPFVLDKNSKAPTHDYVVTEAEVGISRNDIIEGRSVRTPGFKYHVWSRGENREQLFDMVNDPGETRNLATDPKYAEELATHRRYLAEWLKKTDDTYGKNQ
jgi:arylsulfatase A-like enzyme